LSTFDSGKQSLKSILENINSGKIQLPEFQRGWVWDDLHIISLIASVSFSYPIGAVMMLQSGNDNIRFKSRPIEGLNLPAGCEPEHYILDGQQRLTSLFHSIFLNKVVLTRDFKKKSIKRWYYIDMHKALDPAVDREEAIFSIPENKQVIGFGKDILADYSSAKLEYENNVFPLNQIFNASSWRTEYQKHWEYDKEKIMLFNEFEMQIIKTFEQYQIPVIELKKETPKEAVCQVFEKVNTGGVSLTVFELLTATFAVDDFDLRENWMGLRNRLIDIENLGSVAKVLRAVQNDDVLQVISLMSTYEKRIIHIDQSGSSDKAPAVSCKRKDILKMTLDDYKKWSDKSIDGLISAGRLLYSQKIFNDRDLPYRTQLVPLAAILAVLGDKAGKMDAKDKIVRWYWCGVLGELYGGAIETRFANDLIDVVDWVNGYDDQPKTVVEASFSASRLYSLQTRNSAAYKGIYTLLMRDGCRDFITGDTITDQTYFDDKIDIHHIFPSKWCQNQGLPRKKWNSVINKTPLSASTNRAIGGSAPGSYIKAIKKKANVSEEVLEDVMRSHVIDPEHLQSDNFDEFISRREESLLHRISNAMGKDVNRDLQQEDFNSMIYDEYDLEYSDVFDQ
jgi:hypothetical protein